MNYETKEAINRMADMVEETIAMSDDASAYVLQAAQTRLTELRVLLSTFGNKHEFSVEPGLIPLERAVYEVIASLEMSNEAEIEDGLSEQQLEVVLIAKEQAVQNLEQARVSALCMLAHLNSAVLLLNKQRLTPQ